MLKYAICVLFLFLISCKKDAATINETVVPENELKGADISYLPEIRNSHIILYNRDNQAEDMLLTLKKSGVNTVRIRLWKSPVEPNSDFETVKMLAQECKTLGLKVLLTVHYSDTWADPGNQMKPADWQHLTISQLNDSVRNYTREIMSEINPEYFQIGNEINNGFLWPEGSFSNLSTLKLLIATASATIRESGKETKIILHYAGFEHAVDFFLNFTDIDYDIIGLSYYPLWHGKNLSDLQQALGTLSNTFGKSTLIAETSYPFTLEWNDYTHNVIGVQSQLIGEFPATIDGQKNYLLKIRKITEEAVNCHGFCYWGGEWISYKGDTATNGSGWENQAFWDFNNKALPVLEAY